MLCCITFCPCSSLTMIDCMAFLWSLFLLVISIASLTLDSITLFGPVWVWIWIWIFHHDRLLVCPMKILSRCSFSQRTHSSVLHTGGGCEPTERQRQTELTHIDAHPITLAMASLIDILMTSESPVPPPLTVSWLWACPSRAWEYRGWTGGGIG